MKFDMTGINVMLAMPTHRDIPPEVVRSLLETQDTLIRRGIPLTIEMQAGSSLVQHARSKAAHRFLQSDCTRLFWVDSDIVWSSEHLLRLLALSVDLEVVCGAYPAKSEPVQFVLSVADPSKPVQTDKYGCIEVNGLGLGFACIQRRVIERLAEKAPLALFPDVPDGPIPYIFRCDVHDGTARGEDMAFFADVRALGYAVKIDPIIALGHIGPKQYRASFSSCLTQTST